MTAPTSLPPRKERIAKEKKEKKAQTILTVKQTLQEKKPTLDTFVQTEKLKEASNSLLYKVKGFVKRNKVQKEEVTQAQIETSAARPLREEESVPSTAVQTLKLVEEKETLETPEPSIISLPVHKKEEPIVAEEVTMQPTTNVSAEENETEDQPVTREERRKNKFTFKMYHGVLFVFLGCMLCYWWILS